MIVPRRLKLFWGSSYDRGLQYLLFLWEDIKKTYPEAELHIAYGWQTFDKIAGDNPERMKWKEQMEELMKQEGIFHHGRLSKSELQKLRTQCGILAYSTDFFEINCITALECQRDGCVPVVMNFDVIEDNGEIHKTALDETVYAGVKVDGQIDSIIGRDAYLQRLLALMGDRKTWSKLSTLGVKGSTNYLMPKIAAEWDKVFQRPLTHPKVSIITPTIRKGFWNLMAHNIASQTYKNVEWIVVDDFPQNRKAIMQEVLKKWKLKGKYVRGGRTDKFYYGLSTANNIGWKHASGELLVWLQDFVLMPPNGIEMLVDIYRHHPDCLIAPTDVYHFPKIEPNTESEDWFGGQLDVIGKFSWANKRNQKLGQRFTDNPADWEANYGAIPRPIVDALGGWWEFFNDGLGYDNTEMAYRALSKGYKIIIDDSNCCVCLDHWQALKDKQAELGEKREIHLNDPRYEWLIQNIENGKLPLKRDPKKDTFRLEYEIPSRVPKAEAVKWLYAHMDEIIKKWDHIL